VATSWQIVYCARVAALAFFPLHSRRESECFGLVMLDSCGGKRSRSTGMWNKLFPTHSVYSTGSCSVYVLLLFDDSVLRIIYGR